MKKIIKTSFFVSLLLSPIFAFALPPSAQVSLTLSHIERGSQCPSFLLGSPVTLDYQYDFSRNIGQARMLALADTAFQQTLYPLGLSDYYAFMSDMKPQQLTMPQGNVTIYRIIFHLRDSGEAQVFLMLNDDGSCILGSEKEPV